MIFSQHHLYSEGFLLAVVSMCFLSSNFSFVPVALGDEVDVIEIQLDKTTVDTQSKVSLSDLPPAEEVLIPIVKDGIEPLPVEPPIEEDAPIIIEPAPDVTIDDSNTQTPGVISDSIVPATPTDIVPQALDVPAPQIPGTIELTLDEDTFFRLDEPIMFVLATEIPFLLNEQKTETEEHSASGIDAISEAITSFTQNITDHIVDVASHVADTIVTVITDIADTTSEFLLSTKEDLEVEVSSDQVTPSDSPETEIIPVIYPEQGDVVLHNADVYEEHIVVAPIREATKVGVRGVSVFGYIDNIPITMDVNIQNDTHVVISVQNPSLVPGKHSARIELSSGGVAYLWSGDFIWGGEVLQTNVFDDIGPVLVLKELNEQVTLWLKQKDTISFSYVLLDEDYFFDSESPVSYFNGSIFWLSRDRDATYGYELLSHTYFSQSLEKKRDSVIILGEKEYAIKPRVHDFEFVPIPSKDSL